MTAESGKSIRPFLGYERLVNELGYPAYAKKLEAEAMGSNPDGFITERAKLFLNIETVIKNANKLSKQEKYQHSNLDSACHLINDAIESIVTKPENFTGLEDHINKVSNTATELLSTLSQISKDDTTIDPLLSEHEQDLLIKSAELHDKGKKLVDSSGSIDPDHERVISYLIRKIFPLLEIENSDINFIAGVVGDHENVWKEEDHEHLIDSDNHLNCAKGLFLIFDVLTGAVDTNKMANDGIISINSDKLVRLRNIIFAYTDPRQAKAYNPKWGVFTVRDLAHTLQTIADRYNLKTEPGMYEVLFQNVQSGLELLLVMDDARAKEAATTIERRLIGIDDGLPAYPRFADEQRLEINKLILMTKELVNTHQERSKELTLNLLKTRLREIVTSFFDPAGMGYQLAEKASHKTWAAVAKYFKPGRIITSFHDQSNEDKGNNIGNIYIPMNFLFEFLSDPNESQKWLKIISDWGRNKDPIAKKLADFPEVQEFVTHIAMFIHNSYAYSHLNYDYLWSNTTAPNRWKSFIVAAASTDALLNELNKRQIGSDDSEPRNYAIEDPETIKAMCDLNIQTKTPTTSLMETGEAMLKVRSSDNNVINGAARLISDSLKSGKLDQSDEVKHNKRTAAELFELLIQDVVLPSKSVQDLVLKLGNIVKRVFPNPGTKIEPLPLLEHEARIEHALWVVHTLARRGISHFILSPNRRKLMLFFDDLKDMPGIQEKDRIVVASSALIFLIGFIKQYNSENIGNTLELSSDILTLIESKGL